MQDQSTFVPFSKKGRGDLPCSRPASYAPDYMLNDAGPLQVSAGLKGGAEAAICVMKEIYQQDSIESIILIDAGNAFNSMNQQTKRHCTTFSKSVSLTTVLINTYWKLSWLFITGGDEILSKDGTTFLRFRNKSLTQYTFRTIVSKNRLLC